VRQYDKFSLQNIKNITIIMMMLMLPVVMMMSDDDELQYSGSSCLPSKR